MNEIPTNLKPWKQMLKVPILPVIKTKESSVFAIYDIKRLTLLSRLRFSFNLLNECT